MNGDFEDNWRNLIEVINDVKHVCHASNLIRIDASWGWGEWVWASLIWLVAWRGFHRFWLVEIDVVCFGCWWVTSFGAISNFRGACTFFLRVLAQSCFFRHIFLVKHHKAVVKLTSLDLSYIEFKNVLARTHGGFAKAVRGCQFQAETQQNEQSSYFDATNILAWWADTCDNSWYALCAYLLYYFLTFLTFYFRCFYCYIFISFFFMIVRHLYYCYDYYYNCCYYIIIIIIIIVIIIIVIIIILFIYFTYVSVKFKLFNFSWVRGTLEWFRREGLLHSECLYKFQLGNEWVQVICLFLLYDIVHHRFCRWHRIDIWFVLVVRWFDFRLSSTFVCIAFVLFPREVYQNFYYDYY